VVLERSISTVKGNYAAAFYESLGVPVVNPLRVALLCGDKYLTSLCLQRERIPTPRFAMAFTFEQALSAVEELGGFPVVVKPPLGSWGRLLAKINDRDALEAVVEHKTVLGSPQHHAVYIQEFIRKPERDIRAFVVGGRTVCAIFRQAEHWITNTARGAEASNCPITPELSEICRRTAAAVGGGALAVDLLEAGDDVLVNEVNHTMEFKNSEEPTGVSISGAIVDFCLQTAEERKSLGRTEGRTWMSR
jgi:[lysine-biosynthesis-protein LysW]--L-2-aminoadipate ligase